MQTDIELDSLILDDARPQLPEDRLDELGRIVLQLLEQGGGEAFRLE
jgi:hypothetical protein